MPRNNARHLFKLILALVGLTSSITLMMDPARVASGQTVAPSWSYTGNLNAARSYMPATLLPNGKVLVAAGFDYDYNSLNRAELYDPATGFWSPTGSLNTARVYHTATLLTSGKVLVVGGFDAEGSKQGPSFDVNQASSSAE